MTNEETRVHFAIDNSIRENRIVRLEASLDTQEWLGLADALFCRGEDYIEHRDVDGRIVREYWGEDEDGDAWRVHLIGI